MARKGVTINMETLKNGMVLLEREEPPISGVKKYLRGNEFLMVNPFKKVKKTEGPKRAASISRRSKTRNKSKGKSKSPSRRRANSGNDDDF